MSHVLRDFLLLDLMMVFDVRKFLIATNQWFTVLFLPYFMFPKPFTDRFHASLALLLP